MPGLSGTETNRAAEVDQLGTDWPACEPKVLDLLLGPSDPLDRRGISCANRFNSRKDSLRVGPVLNLAQSDLPSPENH